MISGINHLTWNVTDIEETFAFYVPILKMSNTKTVPQKLEAIVRNLASRTSGKPRKVKSLSNAINSLFLKSLGDAELASLVKALEKENHISIEGENVSYRLPDAP